MRIQALILVPAVLLAISSLSSQGIAGENSQIASNDSICPNPRALGDLCYAVATHRPSRDAENDDSLYLYEYQRIVDLAACASIERDTPADYSKKIRALWETSASELKCTAPGFSSVPSSVIKLAIHKQFKDVLIDATQAWKIDLNEVDEGDAMTVLDFTSAEIQRNKGTVNESVLRQYYDILRKAGSKHRTEL